MSDAQNIQVMDGDVAVTCPFSMAHGCRWDCAFYEPDEYTGCIIKAALLHYLTQGPSDD